LDTLEETLTDRTPGGAFFLHPANQARIGPCTDDFLARIRWKFTSPTNQWDTDKLEAYYGQHQEFLELLLVLLQLAGGMPARGPELLSTKVFNTESTSRNIYVHHSLLCTVQSYFKAQNFVARPFYTVRHFPPCTSWILYRYLVYIRPFVRWTEQKLGIGPQFPGYLWPTPSKAPSDAGSKAASNAPSNTGSKSGSNTGSKSKAGSNSKTNSIGSQRGHWATKTISSKLRTVGQDLGLPIDLNMQTLRHWVIGFSKRLLLRPSQANEALKEFKRV
jgi:hypothetical protein